MGSKGTSGGAGKGSGIGNGSCSGNGVDSGNGIDSGNSSGSGNGAGRARGGKQIDPSLCEACKGNHTYMIYCPEFIRADVKDRFMMVAKHKNCARCLTLKAKQSYLVASGTDGPPIRLIVTKS
jgi:hypothetical protein